MKITVREEEERDYRRSEEIIREAFSYPGRVERGGIGCPYEHWMVHELRERDGAGIRLVAEADGVPAGYVACSRAQILVGDTDALPVVNIGPIGVLPEYQRTGIGKALFHAVLERAAEDGWGAVMFFRTAGILSPARFCGSGDVRRFRPLWGNLSRLPVQGAEGRISCRGQGRQIF